MTARFVVAGMILLRARYQNVFSWREKKAGWGSDSRKAPHLDVRSFAGVRGTFEDELRNLTRTEAESGSEEKNSDKFCFDLGKYPE